MDQRSARAESHWQSLQGWVPPAACSAPPGNAVDVASCRTFGKLCYLGCQTGTLFLSEEGGGEGRSFQLLRYCLHKYLLSSSLLVQRSQAAPWMRSLAWGCLFQPEHQREAGYGKMQSLPWQFHANHPHGQISI